MKHRMPKWCISLISSYYFKGQDLAEYGLLVSLIALIVFAGAVLIGVNLQAFWDRLATAAGSW